MNIGNLRYGGYILVILGLIGLLSKTAPAWSVYTVLVLGVIIILVTMAKRA